MKKIVTFVLVFFMLFVTSCGVEAADSEKSSEYQDGQNSQSETEAAMKISITINGKDKLSATLSDNSSSKAFYELLKKGEITVKMHDYGNFEKVGDLPQSLPRNDTQITIYYDTNNWNFTLLGRVDGKTQSELKVILGEGDVTAVFAVAEAGK